MLSHLSSLLSTSAYIGIGFVCKLYQRFPLYQRLQTARQVNRQWAEAVAQQCSTQQGTRSADRPQQ
ncbi:hypothetical protein TYRP_003641 [Tyrophagus putrescentiae]|nr:hypothetical protein TYRP_003641 [Tyrophagus putrescentiae]